MYGYVYCTTNTINGKIYVGQKHSETFLGDRYLGSGKVILQAIQKYGKSAFHVEMLEAVDTPEDLDSKEVYWIDKLNATDSKVGYNICTGGRVLRRMIGTKNPFYGKHHTDESRAKMSMKQQARTDRPRKTAAQKEHMRNVMKGRICTWGDKLKANAKINPNFGMRNKLVKDSTKQALSTAAKVRWSDQAAKAAASVRTAQLWQDPDYRAKHISSMKGRKHAGYEKKECPICNMLIRSSNYDRHLATHNKRS